jgi:hypothetical protein
MPSAAGAGDAGPAWMPSPTSWPVLGEAQAGGGTTASRGALSTEPTTPRAVAAVAGTFAVDGLEGPLNVWLHGVTGLGERVTINWVSEHPPSHQSSHQQGTSCEKEEALTFFRLGCSNVSCLHVHVCTRVSCIARPPLARYCAYACHLCSRPSSLARQAENSHEMTHPHPLHPLTRTLTYLRAYAPHPHQAPYGDLMHQLPSLLRGAAAGGAELVILLVRLEDLCIVHPESRHAPVTKAKKRTGAGDGAVPAQVSGRAAGASEGDATRITAAAVGPSTTSNASTHKATQRDGRVALDSGGQINVQHGSSVEPDNNTTAAAAAQRDREKEREHREKYGCAQLDDADEQLRTASQTLVDVLAGAAPDVAVSLHIFPPPPPDAGERTAEWAHAAAVSEEWIVARVKSGEAGRTRVVTSKELLASLPFSLGHGTVHAAVLADMPTGHVGAALKKSVSWYNRHMDRLAHAPFTPEVHRTAAAACVRAIHRLVVPSVPKVAVLDCDNTLWGGAVAEVMSAPHCVA